MRDTTANGRGLAAPRIGTIDYAMLAYAALALAVRAVSISRYRIDSDEPQHLHVAWMWSRGLVGYRDFYDNHTPLFHLLFAPILRALGETPQILLAARMMMLPLTAAALVLVYLVASELYDRRVALWTVIAASVVPSFLLKTLEFRSDNLWVVWSLLAIALALSPLTPRRAALLGLVLGIGFMTSVKTVWVALALGVVLLIVDRVTMLAAASAIAGGVIPVATAAVWFLRHDALAELYWCAIWLNGQVPVAPARRLIGVTMLLVVATLTIIQLRRMRHVPRARRVVAATAVLFIAFALTLSPLASPRDVLPAMPLLVLFAVAHLRPVAVRLAVVALIALTVFAGRLWRTPDPYQERLVAAVLALTEPHDRVLDLKGESVFRVRPSYMALEVVGRHALGRGIVPETFVDDVKRERCYVATRDADFYPRDTRQFLNEHFLDVGALRVAGSRVDNDGTFTIAIPGRYAVVGDGRDVLEDRWFDAGSYRAPRGASCAIWSPAIERGFWPSGLHHHATR